MANVELIIQIFIQVLISSCAFAGMLWVIWWVVSDFNNDKSQLEPYPVGAKVQSKKYKCEGVVAKVIGEHPYAGHFYIVDFIKINVHNKVLWHDDLTPLAQ